jgi:hypothetical protein
MAKLCREARIRSNLASDTTESFLSVTVDSASDNVDVELFRFAVSADRDRKKASSGKRYKAFS